MSQNRNVALPRCDIQIGGSAASVTIAITCRNADDATQLRAALDNELVDGGGLSFLLARPRPSDPAELLARRTSRHGRLS